MRAIKPSNLITLAGAVALASACQTGPTGGDSNTADYRALLANQDGATGSDGASSWTESCAPNVGGGSLCTYDDGQGTRCVVLLDATEVMQHELCEGWWGSYECNRGLDAIECQLDLGRGSCLDRWTLDTYELIASTCTNAEDGDWDDGDWEEINEECAAQQDGSVLCHYDDGTWVCDYAYDPASGALHWSDCTAFDGTTYDCIGSGDRVTCIASMEGQELCRDLFDAWGNPIDLGCYSDDGGDEWEEEPREDCATPIDGQMTCTFDDGSCSGTTTYDAQGEVAWFQYRCTDGTSESCSRDAALGVYQCSLVTTDGMCCSYVMDAARGCLVSETCGWAEDDPEAVAMMCGAP